MTSTNHTQVRAGRLRADCRSTPNAAADEFGELEKLPVDQLRIEWGRRLGGEAPKLRTRELLALALAYRLQARSEGDLSGVAKRKLSEFQRRFARDRDYTPTAGPVLKPGSSLIKAWRGVRHEVIVLEEGFGYLGERHGSLSEVALRITGTKWNGHVFFGLRARSK